MILKKPYAFLIKNFRKIHILLTILTGFIIFETHQLVVFFRDYIANNYSVTVTDNLVSTTISPWLYISIIVTILILVAVYILLKTKKKPTKMYFFSKSRRPLNPKHWSAVVPAGRMFSFIASAKINDSLLASLRLP